MRSFANLVLPDWILVKSLVSELNAWLGSNPVHFSKRSVITVTLKITGVWSVTPCSLAGIYQHFTETYCVHVQGRRMSHIGIHGNRCIQDGVCGRPWRQSMNSVYYRSWIRISWIDRTTAEFSRTRSCH
jgi:hypothetical protein